METEGTRRGVWRISRNLLTAIPTENLICMSAALMRAPAASALCPTLDDAGERAMSTYDMLGPYDLRDD